MSSPTQNIAAYQFVSLTDLPVWRECLHAQAQAQDLKGTILVAEEGINLFLAGRPESMAAFEMWLRAQPVFSSIELKHSWSNEVPFKRLKVKIKKEIIRMDHPTIRPHDARAPALDPQTARRWIDQGVDDQGRQVVLLDTRNDFEVQAGTFAGAIQWQLERFTQFPEAVKQHRDALEGSTVISFCTGGIRCEKAAIYMQEMGLSHVYQLEGGILKYFEVTDGLGFEGNCFVFDERETVNAALAPEPLRAT